MSSKRTWFFGLLLIGILWFLVRDTDPVPVDQHQESPSPAPLETAEHRPTNRDDSSVTTAARHQAGQEQTTQTLSGASAYGQVVHVETGAPVAGAVVWLAHSSEHSQMETRSDARGSFRFEGLSPGHYYYFAKAKGLISFINRSGQPSFLVDQETISIGPLLLQCTAARELILTVVSQLDRSPVRDAWVALQGSPRELFRGDEMGQVRLYLTPETWNLEVWAEGYERVSTALNLGGKHPMSFTIALPRGGRFFGKVRDPDGVPIADAQISAHAITGEKDRRTHSDSAGNYVLENLKLENDWYLRAAKAGFQGQSQKFRFEKEQMEVDLVLTKEKPRTLEIWGKVVDTQDQPIPAARLTTGFSMETLGITDSRGNYRFKGPLAPELSNSIHMAARASGFSPTVKRVRILPGQESIEVNLTLDSGSWLQGHVTDMEGQAVSGVQLHINTPLDFIQLTDKPPITGPDGSFSLEDMPQKIDIQFRKTGFAPQRLQNPTMNRDDLLVSLSGAGRIHGRVRDARGRVVEEFRVQVHRTSHLGRGLWAYKGIEFSSSDGTFTIADLAMRPRLLAIEAACCPTSYFDNVRVEENPKTVDFDLGLDHTRIAGVVANARGQPRPNIPIALLIYDRDKQAPTKVDLEQVLHGYRGNWLLEYRLERSDPSGFFSFDDVPRDRQVDLLAEAPGLVRTRLSRVFDSPQESWQQLTLVMADAGAIHVHVDRETYPSGTLFLTTPDRKEEKKTETLSDSENPIIFSELMAGVYQLQLRDSGDKYMRVMESEQINLAEAETVEVTLGDEKRYRIAGTALSGARPAGNRALALFPQGGDADWIQRSATDSQGYFTFDKIKPGDYTLVLGGGAMEGISVSPHGQSNSHDLSVFSDVEDVFIFRDFSTVTGRLVSGNYQNLELGELMSNQRQRRFPTLSQDGAFSIPGVPPGTFYLKGILNRGGQNILVPSFNVPNDGSDVDLGVLDEAPGRLVLHIVGSARQCVLAVDLFNTGWNPDHYQNGEGTRFNVPFTDKALLQDVPAGETVVAPRFLACAMDFVPRSQVVEIQPDKEVELTFQIIPITDLEINVTGSQHSLVHVSLQNDSEVFELPKYSRGNSLPITNNVAAAFWERSARVRNLPEGPWTFHVTNARGETLSVGVVLERGKKLKHSVLFQD